jgi:hypothetical protein
MMMAWLAIGAFASDEADLEAYLDQRLDVVERDVSGVYARGYDGGGRFWFVVDHDGASLDALAFAERVGDVEIARQLRARRRGRAAGGAALLGLGVISGAVAAATTPTVVSGTPRAVPLTAFAGAGVGLASGTLVLAGRVKQRHPSAAYTQDQATERVREHNAMRREEILGPPP